MLSQPNSFQLSAKYCSDTSFLLKPFESFCFPLNLFNPASVAVVFDFALSYPCFPCSFAVNF